MAPLALPLTSSTRPHAARPAGARPQEHRSSGVSLATTRITQLALGSPGAQDEPWRARGAASGERGAPPAHTRTSPAATPAAASWKASCWCWYWCSCSCWCARAADEDASTTSARPQASRPPRDRAISATLRAVCRLEQLVRDRSAHGLHVGACDSECSSSPGPVEPPATCRPSRRRAQGPRQRRRRRMRGPLADRTHLPSARRQRPRARSARRRRRRTMRRRSLAAAPMR